MKSRQYFAVAVVVAALLLPSISHAVGVGDCEPQQPTAQPTQLIVKFKPDTRIDVDKGRPNVPRTNLAAINALHERYQVKEQRTLARTETIRTSDNPLRDVHILQVDEGVDLETMARDYSQLDIVEYAHPDYPLELHDTPNDSLYPHQWALHNTGQGYYHVERLEG